MRRAASLVVVPLLAGLLAACAGMPTDGPVVTTRDRGNGTAQQGPFDIEPLPPQPGQSRTEVARGFINAMQAWPSDLATAKEFLTTDAAAAWNPQQEMITYDTPPTPREAGSEVAVTLAGARRLDARGAWQGAVPARQRTLELPMTQLEDGSWRITAAPDALIVPQEWFSSRYRQVSVYFFDPTASILEPEPVFVPVGQQLATTLTEALLEGPGAGLQRVAQTFIPPGLDVAVGVAVSDDGVADVLLTGDPGQLSADTIELMMAQFAWTLRQESKVQSVRVTIGGQPVPLPGGVSSYRVDGGAEFDPAGFQSSPLLYGISDGRLVSGTAAALGRVDGPFGDRSYGLRSAGVDLAANRAAGVTEDGSTVYAAPLADAGPGQVRTVATGTDFLRPAWDFSDRMWLVDRNGGAARVFHVDPHGGRVAPLRVPGLTGERVRMFLVSRDSTRLVAVVRRGGDDLLMVSRVEHNAAGDVIGALPAQRIAVGDAELPIRAVSWRTPASLAVLNPLTPSFAQVAPASVDGAPVNPGFPATVDGRVLGLAGSPVPEESIYGVTRRGLIDVGATDHPTVPFEEPTTAVVYVG